MEPNQQAETDTELVTETLVEGCHRRHVRGLLTVVAYPSPASKPVAFDPDLSWRLHHQVAVRPEPFGALLYHFGCRSTSGKGPGRLPVFSCRR